MRQLGGLFVKVVRVGVGRDMDLTYGTWSWACIECEFD
jgi:hypothetical protein